MIVFTLMIVGAILMMVAQINIELAMEFAGVVVFVLVIVTIAESISIMNGAGEDEPAPQDKEQP